MKIGFFDSGLGGLTVLKKCIQNCNLSDDIYYLGDTKNTPYGVKEESFVKQVIEENIKYLIDLGCNPIVIACNTATCLLISQLREKYKDITFIGTEPAVKVAADAHMNKRILVLATSITIKQEKLLSLVDRLDIKENVDLVAADKLVVFAEDINCKDKEKEVEEYIESILKNLDLNKYSHIVLGCTHFPLFTTNFYNVINRLYKDANIKIVDGAEGISKELNRHINSHNTSTKGRIHIVMTSESEAFKTRAKEILNMDNLAFDYKLQ